MQVPSKMKDKNPTKGVTGNAANLTSVAPNRNVSIHSNISNSPNQALKPKPRILVIGTSMLRNTGPILSHGLSQLDTCVYSISGLTIDSANIQNSKPSGWFFER